MSKARRSRAGRSFFFLASCVVAAAFSVTVSFLGSDPGKQGPPKEKSAETDFRNMDPLDPRFKNRKFEWFFTESDEDVKLADLPRPSFLPPSFWEWFYEKGIAFALFQSVGASIAFAAIFVVVPPLLDGILVLITGRSTVPPPT